MVQDGVILLALLLPTLILAVILLRGHAPGRLVRALLWRFRWANVMFVVLIAIAIGLGAGLIAQERGLRQGTAQAADKFDMIVSAPGSEVTMMLAAVYLQPTDVPLLDGATYAEIEGHERVSFAAPLGFGDSFEGAPVVGTTAEFVTYLTEDRVEGRLWQIYEEAVAGASVPLEIGDVFEPAHGHGEAAEEGAHGVEITVVGKMPRTGSPWDKSILVPIESVWEVHGLATGHAPERADQIGPPFDAEYFPGTPAAIVKPASLGAAYGLRSEFTRDKATMAFFPGAVLSNLYRIMGDVRQAMSLMATVTQILVAASVLLGLFILTRLFRRQTALLRALGAPPRFVVATIWSYAAILILVGAALGIVLGLVAASILSSVVSARTDILVTASLGWTEFHGIAAFVSLTTLLALLPALAVLRGAVTDGLRG